jgi:hypothetical protein
MKEKVTKLEKQQKLKINQESGVIYIFQIHNSTENSLYKIGKKIDLSKRLSYRQSALSNDIEILFYYESENITEIERCIKKLMKNYQYRKYKKVYKINIDIIKSLVQ